jgi:hypothetical protein
MFKITQKIFSRSKIFEMNIKINGFSFISAEQGKVFFMSFSIEFMFERFSYFFGIIFR